MRVMRIRLNGETRDIAPESTVAALLEALDLSATRCAVEVNGQIAPKILHRERRLAEDDRVEIVTLVGGG